MAFETSQEVYVVFEGVFALEPGGASTGSGWVTVRTPSGARVELPVEAVAEWDVDTPVRPDGHLAELGAPAARGVPW